MGDEKLYLAQNLKYLRKQKGLNQNDLAEILGIKRSTVGNWETDRREPELNMLVYIAKYFRVTIDDLLLKDLRSQGSMLSRNLKYLRNREHYSQNDMARLLEVCKSNISKYESGAVELSNQDLINVSEIFDVTIDDLLKKDLAKEGV